MKGMIGIAAILIVCGVVTAMYAGVVSFSALGNLNTVTSNTTYGNFKGYGELCGPGVGNKEGYISSWKENGFSETITVMGRIKVEPQFPVVATAISKYSYIIYGFVGTEWIALSTPTETKMYITGTNPGEITPQSGITWDGVVNLAPYSFNVVGPDVKGIRAEFWCYIDWDIINPFDGFKWTRMQTDEAYIYSGYGGLYLPRGLDEDNPDLPYSTFQIGDVVRIGVETAKGGYTEDNLPWRVTLNEPYSGTIDTPNSGGGVIFEHSYPDDCSASNTFFEFTVTEAMAAKTMSTGLPYTVRIWNTVLPMGTLNIDFIDFYYLAPGKVIMSGPTTAYVNDVVTISMTAESNEQTQADTDFFRVSVVYGKADTLLPSDWGDGRWIVHTTDVGLNDHQACSLPQQISFSAADEGYVTVFAKVFDVLGRPSLTTQTYTVYIGTQGNMPPDDAIEDDVGQDDYGGGHTSPWLPWDPSDSPWWNTATNMLLTYIVMILIVAIFALIAFAVPLPYSPISKILVFLLGVAIALLLYFFPPW